MPGFGEVNFLSHAALTAEFDPTPLVVFGAMLPDLAAMVRLPLPRRLCKELGLGVAWHLRQDELFHDLPAVRCAMSAGAALLETAGLGRGAARASSHVGLELLMDEQLWTKPATRRAFESALEVADPDSVAELADWALPERLEDLSQLRERLLRRLETPQAASPELLAQRLAWTLQGRPRVELRPDQLPLVSSWFAAEADKRQHEFSSWLGSLRLGLSAPIAHTDWHQ